MDDPYTVLGVARDAGADEIRSAYRKLAKQNHPDLNPGNAAALAAALAPLAANFAVAPHRVAKDDCEQLSTVRFAAINPKPWAPNPEPGDDPRVDLGPRHARHAQREAHVLPHAHMRVERVGLEHHGDAAAGWMRVGDALAVNPHLAAARLLQPRQQAQQRALAATAGADEHHELAARRLQAHAVHDRQLAVALHHVLKAEE